MKELLEQMSAEYKLGILNIAKRDFYRNEEIREYVASMLPDPKEKDYNFLSAELDITPNMLRKVKKESDKVAMKNLFKIFDKLNK